MEHSIAIVEHIKVAHKRCAGYNKCSKFVRGASHRTSADALMNMFYTTIYGLVVLTHARKSIHLCVDENANSSEQTIDLC